jgi:hypothetical protein
MRSEAKASPKRSRVRLRMPQREWSLLYRPDISAVGPPVSGETNAKGQASSGGISTTLLKPTTSVAGSGPLKGLTLTSSSAMPGPRLSPSSIGGAEYWSRRSATRGETVWTEVLRTHARPGPHGKLIVSDAHECLKIAIARCFGGRPGKGPRALISVHAMRRIVPVACEHMV